MTRSPAENQQTVEAALDEICPAAYAVDCDLPEHEKARAAHGALRDLVAQAERAERAEAALRRIQEWDCLNPPDPNLCHDHPWLKRLVDDALAAVVADSREPA